MKRFIAVRWGVAAILAIIALPKTTRAGPIIDVGTVTITEAETNITTTQIAINATALVNVAMQATPMAGRDRGFAVNGDQVSTIPVSANSVIETMLRANSLRTINATNTTPAERTAQSFLPTPTPHSFMYSISGSHTGLPRLTEDPSAQARFT